MPPDIEPSTPVQPPKLDSRELEPKGGMPQERRFGLPVTLSVVVGVAVLLTAINMALYFSSNLSRIDLSKPKYADIRKDLRPSEQASSPPKVDTTSPVTSDAVQEQINVLTKRRDALRKLGGFNSSILDDSSLGIGTDENAASDPQAAPPQP